MLNEKISSLLLDYPEVNALIGEKEFSPEQMQTASQLTVDEWNDTPPLLSTKYTISNFPYSSTLLFGTIYYLFMGKAAEQDRNQLPYSSGGLSVDDSGRGPKYIQYASIFRQKFLKNMELQKSQKNISQGWGTIHSDYINIAWGNI